MSIKWPHTVPAWLGGQWSWECLSSLILPVTPSANKRTYQNIQIKIMQQKLIHSNTMFLFTSVNNCFSGYLVQNIHKLSGSQEGKPKCLQLPCRFRLSPLRWRAFSSHGSDNTRRLCCMSWSVQFRDGTGVSLSYSSSHVSQTMGSGVWSTHVMRSEIQKSKPSDVGKENWVSWRTSKHEWSKLNLNISKEEVGSWWLSPGFKLHHCYRSLWACNRGTYCVTLAW